MIYDIILNMEKSGIKPRIKVSQYDKTLPQIRATLYSNNQPFNVPSGSTVYISGTKKDNTGFKYECTFENNVVTADITDQMTAFSGDVEVEFTIESSGSRKGTENFILEVEPTALADDVIISETDIPAIQRLSQPASTTQLGVVKVDGTSVTIDEDGTLHSTASGSGTVKSVNNINPDANGNVTVPIPDELADLTDDATHRLVTDTEKTTWNGKSVVSVTQIKSSGEKIATINVNGTDTDLYASAGGGGGGGAVDSVNGMTGDVVLDLDDIHDTAISSPTDGQVLGYDSTTSKWTNINQSGGVSSVNGETGAVVLDADDISDTNTTNKFVTATEKSTWSGKQDALTFTSTPSASNKVVTSDDLPTVPSDIDDLSDVEITSPSNGQVLGYDGSKWTNVSGGSGGGHTIKNESGTALTQRDNLQFKGCSVSDDSTNNATVVSVQTSNRNLLDNAWFTVNQKGFSSKTSSSSESNDKFMDRWKANWFAGYPTQIVLNSDDTLSLKINKNSTYGTTAREIRILQEIEDYESLIGKQCTMSIMLADGTIYSTTKIVPSTGQAESTTTFATGKKITFAFDNRNSGMYKNAMWVRFQITSDIYTSSDSYEELKIKAIKLEIGSQSTLAFDTVPDYTTELLKCQKYLYPLGGKSFNAMVSALQQTRQWLTITLPTEMRAVPTFSGSLTTEGISGSTRVEDTVTSSNITVTKTQDIEFNFTTSSNYNLCSCARVSFASGSYLSAEL